MQHSINNKKQPKTQTKHRWNIGLGGDVMLAILDNYKPKQPTKLLAILILNIGLRIID